MWPTAPKPVEAVYLQLKSSLKMQRLESRPCTRGQVDNKVYEWQTRRCVYVDLFIYASILAPTKVPVATGIETLRSAPVVYRDAVLLMGQYGKPTNTTLIHL